MTSKNRFRPANAVIQAAALLCIVSLIAWAADSPFAGKWKGEAKAAAAPTGGAGAPGGAGASGGGGAPGGGGGGGGRGGFGGGGGGGRGGFGGGFGAGGAQKVSLNLKQKDNKLSGNIVFGDNDAYDVKDGKIEGNTFTFKAGRAPQPTYIYKGELKENEILLSRVQEGGGGRPQDYVLKKK